jgi:hypothetical protein
VNLDKIFQNGGKHSACKLKMNTRLISVVPKLPALNLDETLEFYSKLKFKLSGDVIYPDYLMIHRDDIELHFFLHCDLNVLENYGMCYIRVQGVDGLYKEFKKIIPELKPPELKPWGQKEFYLADNNHNGLAFGEYMG